MIRFFLSLFKMPRRRAVWEVVTCDAIIQAGGGGRYEYRIHLIGGGGE